MYNIDPEKWVEEAKVKEVHPKVISFIEENPEKLFSPAENLYPRGWEYISGVLNSHAKLSIVRNIDKVRPSFAEALNKEVSNEFIRHYLSDLEN